MRFASSAASSFTLVLSVHLNAQVVGVILCSFCADQATSIGSVQTVALPFSTVLMTSLTTQFRRRLMKHQSRESLHRGLFCAAWQPWRSPTQMWSCARSSAQQIHGAIAPFAVRPSPSETTSSNCRAAMSSTRRVSSHGCRHTTRAPFAVGGHRKLWMERRKNWVDRSPCLLKRVMRARSAHLTALLISDCSRPHNTGKITDLTLEKRLQDHTTTHRK